MHREAVRILRERREQELEGFGRAGRAWPGGGRAPGARASPAGWRRSAAAALLESLRLALLRVEPLEPVEGQIRALG